MFGESKHTNTSGKKCIYNRKIQSKALDDIVLK